MDKNFLLLRSPLESDIHRVSWYLPATKKSTKKTVSEVAVQSSQGSGTIDDFLRVYREGFQDKDVAIIISGQYLTYTNVALAVKNQRQMLQALPFLVEEQVIGNIEDMHIAVPEKLAGESVRIAIIDKVSLDKLKAFFVQYKIPVSEFFGFPDLLVCNEGEVQILLNDEFAIVKGSNSCFECDQASLEAILELMSWENISTINISLSELDKQSLALAKRIKTRLSSKGLKIKSALFTEDVLSYILRIGNGDTNNSLNILQGDLSAASSRTQQFQQLLPLVWVAVLCLCLQIAFNIASGFYFNRLADSTKQNGIAQYLQLFPEEKKVVNLASQLNAKVNSLALGSQTSRFPVIFATTVKAIGGVGGRADIKLKQFRYDESSGELKIGLDTSSIALLDKIKNKLMESNFIVEIISANEENGIIRATLSVKYA